MIFCRRTYQEGAKIRKRNTGIIAVKHGCAIASLIGAVLELGRVGAINERLIRVVVKVELADGDVRLFAYYGQRKGQEKGHSTDEHLRRNSVTDLSHQRIRSHSCLGIAGSRCRAHAAWSSSWRMRRPELVSSGPCQCL